MISLGELLHSREKAIVFHATPEDIAAKRRDLQKWYQTESAAIPKMARLVADIMGSGDSIVRRVAVTSADLVKANDKAAALLKRYGAPLVAQAIEIGDRVDLELEHHARKLDLERLARRSETSRFAISPAPAASARTH